MFLSAGQLDALADLTVKGSGGSGDVEALKSFLKDKDNKALITADMQAAVDKATADIKSGKVQVHDYMADSACPVQ